LSSLDPACQDALDETTSLWQARRAGPNYEGSTQSFTSASGVRPETTLPPRGPGELDTPLGIPLLVLCHNAEYTHTLGREHGWSDTHFDYILQTLRTILLKHGASLIYTSTSDSSKPMTDLIHSSLAIHSLIRKAVVKPEAIVRDQILIPAHWDTWGKIRTLDADFDVEGVSTAWSILLDQKDVKEGSESTAFSTSTPAAPDSSLFTAYEQKIRNPTRAITSTLTSSDSSIAATSQARPDYQAFLATQLPILKRLEAEDAAEIEARQAALAASGAPPRELPTYNRDNGEEAQGPSALDFVGPVQINVGGVTVDVEAALQGMRDRAAASTGNDEAEADTKAKVDDESSADKKRLEWFATLASRRKSGGSSIPGSPAAGK
jgi:dynein light intermediate chain 1